VTIRLRSLDLRTHAEVSELGEVRVSEPPMVMPGVTPGSTAGVPLSVVTAEVPLSVVMAEV
jgi:hypothetical protein